MNSPIQKKETQTQREFLLLTFTSYRDLLPIAIPVPIPLPPSHVAISCLGARFRGSLVKIWAGSDPSQPIRGKGHGGQTRWSSTHPLTAGFQVCRGGQSFVMQDAKGTSEGGWAMRVECARFLSDRMVFDHLLNKCTSQVKPGSSSVGRLCDNWAEVYMASKAGGRLDRPTKLPTTDPNKATALSEAAKGWPFPIHGRL
jgi:hypothetical protein